MKTLTLFFISVLYFISPGFQQSPEASSGEELYIDATSTNLPVSIVTGPSMDMETADVDGDGDPDIILAREFAPNKLLLNNGNGVYSDGTAGRLPQFSYDSEDIGIADFDHDGDPDIVFASEDNMIHELYFNDGNGFFRNENAQLPNSIANSVIAADINNDNNPDIILGNAGQDFILINNGDTTFTNETASRLPASADITQDLKLADIDNDTDKDLIAGNEDGNKIYINNGSGFFTDETLTRLPASSVEETRKVSLADIDNDSDLDIFFANVAFIPGRNRQDRLLRNNGAGVFEDITSSHLPADNEHTTEGIFIDADYDGDVDLVTSNIFFNRPMKIFLNNGAGVFTEATESIFPPNVIAEGIGVKSDDFNRDGFMDLYLIHRNTGATGLSDRLLLRKDTGAVGINFNQNQKPEEYSLRQNYPNPFNPSTTFEYSIAKEGIVRMNIYDVSGKKLGMILNEYKNAGNYKVKLNSSDISLTSGIYFVEIIANDFEKTIKIVLNK